MGALFVQQSTELQLAPGNSGRYHLRGCGYDLLNLALAQFMGGLRLHQIVNTGRTAAERRLRHFQTRDGAQRNARS